jgi:hypothetical protein
MKYLLKSRQKIFYFTGIFRKIISVAILIPLIYGCTPATSTGVPIYGTVMLDGIPIENGNIMFFEKNIDRSYSTVIHDGKYKLNMLPGEKRVCILAVGQTKTMPRNDFSGDTAVEMIYESIIPKKYNTQTILSCTTDSKGGEQNFELLSQ